jgi:hypothetical protein
MFGDEERVCIEPAGRQHLRADGNNFSVHGVQKRKSRRTRRQTPAEPPIQPCAAS